MDGAGDSWIENRIVCGSVIVVLSSFAILANLGIILNHRLPNNKPIISLAISSISFQLCNLVVYVPCSFTSCPFYGELLIEVLSFPNTVCYNVCHLCFTHLSIERMLVFYSDCAHRQLQKRGILIAVLIWIYVLILAGVGTVLGCVKTFDVPTLRYFYNATRGSTVYNNVYLGHSCLFALIMVTCYIMIFFKLRKIASQLGSKKKEIKLVIQYFFVSAFAWFSIIFFYFIPNIKVWLNLKLTLLPTMVSTISASSHCYVFFLFDKNLRHSVVRLFKRKPDQVSANRLRSTGGTSTSR